MRVTKPRIVPMTDAEMGPEQREALKPFGTGPIFNIFRTLARAPKALTRFNEWGGYILSRRNDLPPREREIVILRIGFLCKSGYEWTQHVAIGKREGLSDDEIARIKKGAGAGWARRGLVHVSRIELQFRELHAGIAEGLLQETAGEAVTL